MKTLDEVIDYCEGKQTCGEWIGIADVLHYMKEYKRVQNKIEKIALGNIEDTLDKIDNPALTWDELKQMKGKPVWVEPCREWMLITLIDNGSIWLLRLDGMDYDLTLHDSWQAYRKERS